MFTSNELTTIVDKISLLFNRRLGYINPPLFQDTVNKQSNQYSLNLVLHTVGILLTIFWKVPLSS